MKKAKKQTKSKNAKIFWQKLFVYSLPVWFLLGMYSLMFLGSSDNFDWQKQKVDIRRNYSAVQVIDVLAVQNIIVNPYNFRLALLLSGNTNNLHAGRFKLSPAMSVNTIISILSEKKGYSTNSAARLVIPEGYSLQEIMERLDSANIVTMVEFNEYLKTMDRKYWQDQYDFLKNVNLDNKHFFEGYLYPDTYIFAENSSPEIVLDTMLKNFANKVPDLYTQQNQTKLNLHQMLTLASIVEKEAQVESERNLVAGVLYNRYRKWMHLGSCPTVKYALGRPRQPYLLYKELDVVSPYNTYRHIGLPPGPICSPGLLSIQAVLQPPVTKYFYFVSKGNGEHYFSETMNQHLNYQKEVLGSKVY